MREREIGFSQEERGERDKVTKNRVRNFQRTAKERERFRFGYDAEARTEVGFHWLYWQEMGPRGTPWSSNYILLRGILGSKWCPTPIIIIIILKKTNNR